MPISKIRTTSKIWVREFSTTIYNKITGALLEIDFIRRNVKSIIVCALIWLVSVTGGYWVYHGAGERLKNEIFEQGVIITKNLAAKTGPALLGDDLLSLNTAVGKLSRQKKVHFVGILDYRNTIVAHTDPDKVNHAFKPLKTIYHAKTIKKVAIDIQALPDNKKIITFSTPVNFSGIKIGKVYYVIAASYLHDGLTKYTVLFVTEVIFSLLILSLILFLVNRSSKAKELETLKEMEDMTLIGPYRLVKKIAQGGMAELFVAEYERIDGFRRTVAIKRVLPHLAQNRDFINMFIREARLAAILQHPNIVQIVDFGKINDTYFIAMDYIRGKNLAEIMSSMAKGMTADQSVFIITQILKGLEFSHTKKNDKTKEPLNIVHRDISPQNMLISFLGEVKITDYGISKASSEPSLTQAGVIKGKVSYMSPEQALGQTVDKQTDIYALGIVFYETLTGQRLFQFASDLEAIKSIPTVKVEQVKKSRPDIPDELNRIVMKCLEKDKSLRYQSAQEVYDDLILLKKRFNMTYDSSNLSSFMKSKFTETEADIELFKPKPS